MPSLSDYIDDQLSTGKSWFSQEDALMALSLERKAFIAAASRLAKKQRLISPRRGFYLILRPEDWASGAPDPIYWIDPLMKYLGVDYRISLLRAADYHGASHQASMIFQVIVPKQLRSFVIGQHKLEFIYQATAAFTNTNNFVTALKNKTGYANVTGVELTLFDCVRYFHKAGGISSVAQVCKDLGALTNPATLAKIAEFFDNTTVRRLGYLLDLTEHSNKTKLLEPFVKKAKAMKPLNPSVKPISKKLVTDYIKNQKWKLIINEQVETDY